MERGGGGMAASNAASLCTTVIIIYSSLAVELKSKLVKYSDGCVGYEPVAFMMTFT